jgi:hypothetical protein
MPPSLNTATVRQRIEATDDGQYSLIGEYISAKDPIKILHRPCGNIITVRAKGFMQEGAGRCKICYPVENNRNLTRVTEKEFIERCLTELGNEYTYLGGFVRYKEKVLMRHNICGTEWEITPHMLLGSKQRRCPVCANKSRGSHLRFDDYLQRVLNSQPYGKNYEWLEEYLVNDNKKKLLIRHKACGTEYYVRPNDFQQGYKCPICHPSLVVESAAVKLIDQILTELNIQFERETSYVGLKNINQLYFDFDIPLDENNENHLIIEYDGAQHFTLIKNNKKQLENSQKCDAIKDKFCADNVELNLERIDYRQDVRKELMRILNQYNLI